MLTRRELLVAGGLALTGRLVPSSAWARQEATRQATNPVAEIAMRASGGGARVWFDPVGLLVPPGTTLRWVLVEGVHTTTAYHPANGDFPRRIPEGARPWDSGYLVEPGATFEVALDLPGVYDFLCRPHEAAGMVGRIVVGTATSVDEPRQGSGVAAPWYTDDRGLPRAAARALPAVSAILREGVIHAEGGPG